ncbi:CHASE2 domain-containing protein [Stenotrophomonas cyclobalanopsidis]|uniref:diguanylate cyclase n=1 Tax=Stenotrophomonas cyclobalanopsidis TaxID=2771362 RepID=A0ABQ6T0A0_9GAMM|nr:CHASE2 domain-containing protein [Stenotrophomonas cyclobalanopsidis]KAA8997882.1 CHASE2 domain-containing protein [Stenotrophomonas cyclobalanopsidis]
MRRSPLPWSRRILLALLAGIATAVVSHGQLLWRQDEAVYDLLVGDWEYRPDPSVLIVAIDEDSLQRIGQWPWPRSVHARLLDRLTDAGVERVVLDLMLSEPDRHDARQDAELAAAIRRNGRVVLPVLAAPAAGDRLAEELLPIPLIADSAAVIGHSDVEVDGDGVARGVYLRAGIGQAHWPSLGMALAGIPANRVYGLADPEPALDSPYQWRRDDYVRVRYAGPPGRLPQVSYADVLDGQVDASLLRGRRIVVGMTASGIAPPLLTPTTREYWMSGSEYQANIASMLLQDEQINVLPRAVQDLLSGLMAALCVMLLGLRLPWLAALCSLPLAPVLAWLLLRVGNLWWAPASAQLGVLLILLVWAVWRISAWHRQANRDALTGLGNRLRFEQALQEECDAARRSGKPLSLALIDVDHFKHHNDRHGHQAGDGVLRDVARLIAAHARRPRDMAARYGGDEFALVLPDTPADGARLVVEDLIASVRALPSPGDGSGAGITLTIGVYTRVPDGSLHPHHFVEGADAALYRAKDNGRDGYAISGDP